MITLAGSEALAEEELVMINTEEWDGVGGAEQEDGMDSSEEIKNRIDVGSGGIDMVHGIEVGCIDVGLGGTGRSMVV